MTESTGSYNGADRRPLLAPISIVNVMEVRIIVPFLHFFGQREEEKHRNGVSGFDFAVAARRTVNPERVALLILSIGPHTHGSSFGDVYYG